MTLLRPRIWYFGLWLVALPAGLCMQEVAAQHQTATGTISGMVVDMQTKDPLVGANVAVKDTRRGASTEMSGMFVIPGVALGSHTIHVSCIGYDPLSVTDVVVRPDNISFVNAELAPTAIETEDVIVTAGYFPELRAEPISIARFSSEEIRRAATIGGDINRIVNGLPGLSNENQYNYIVARGGSAVENSFYIDNIRVPNINHFPVPGTSGGGVSFLNVDFIRQLDISTGGFAARYGDALSSVLDIGYREGNREQLAAQADLNFTGVSVALEGPLAGGTGSYLASAKHSFTDILFAIIDTDQEPVVYDEVQAKIVLDLSPGHQISMLQIFGKDRWTIRRDEAITRSDNGYGGFSMTENVTGLSWRALWGKSGYSNTSLSWSLIENNIRLFRTADQTDRFLYQTGQEELTLRNVNRILVGRGHRMEFGFDLRHVSGTFDNTYAPHTNQLGTYVPRIRVDNSVRSWKTAFFLSSMWSPLPTVEILPGVRLDYFLYNKRVHISPRLSLAWHIDGRTTVSGAAGLSFQHVPMFFLAQRDEFRRLNDMRAFHVVLGFNRLLSDDTRLSVEVYRKMYRDCPMDPAQGGLFILDENIYNQFYTYREHLVSSGEARTSGVEILVQKKLSGNFYGLLSGAYYKAEYRGLDGVWRNRITDNRMLFAVELGFKPDAEWEFNLRWSYAGGIPYTPFDRSASTRAGTGIYDRSRIMAERLPPYSCLNMRVDRRFHFERSNLIVYLAVWNVLGRENVSYHYWDEVAGSASNYTQWPTLPVVGLSFEF